MFTVAFDDADSEGIVFFGNYFRLAHRALERWFPTVGIKWSEWFEDGVYGVPLIHAEADYLSPLRPGQEFGVRLSVNRIGSSSVTFGYEFVAPDGKPLARLKTAHVFIDRKSRAKTSIPDSLRARLEAVR